MQINKNTYGLPGPAIRRGGVLLLLCALITISACNNIPNHARYIPKDAIAVLGINAKNLGKKVAWNALTGSKLFKQMMELMPNKGSKDTANMLASAGIDISNTFYVYVKGNKRSANGNRATAIIPLSSASDWESFVKRSFPRVAIKQQDGRKEADLTKGMYAGWNDKLLILIDILPDASGNTYNGMSNDSSTAVTTQPTPDDETLLAAEMQSAFTVAKDNSLYEDKRFAKLLQDGHDISFWINYDQLMTNFGTDGLSGMMGGLSLSNSLWKNAAFAGGFDFAKGQIKGDMLYYIPDSLKDICKELGADNADKEMIDKLPGQNLDVLFAMHLAPKGLKDMLEKMGVSGLANAAVSQKGIDNTDYVFDAFTGDMAFVLSDFTVKNQPSAFDSMMGRSKSYKANMNALFVLKINKQENFNKLMQIVTENAHSMGNNTYYFPVSDKDSIFIMMNSKYAAIGNKYAGVTNFIQGSNSDKLPAAAASSAYGHPFAMYFDMQQMVKTIDPSMGDSPNDSVIIAEGKKLLDNATLTGGDFKDNAFEYHVSINFMNKDENSLIELMNFAMKVSDANNKPQ